MKWVQMKVWREAEAKRRGISCSAVAMDLTRGGYPELQRRRLNKRRVLVEVADDFVVPEPESAAEPHTGWLPDVATAEELTRADERAVCGCGYRARAVRNGERLCRACAALVDEAEEVEREEKAEREKMGR